MAGRGMLTAEAQKLAVKHLGREIILRELRLMPYIQFVMMNAQEIDPRKVNEEERAVLKKWREEGHIEGGASGLAITKEFWDAINDILFETYIKCEVKCEG